MMQKFEDLTNLIADEIMNLPESERVDTALQVASSMIEICGYEMARSGTIKSSSRLFLMANELERLRRAERQASEHVATIVAFPDRSSARVASA